MTDNADRVAAVIRLAKVLEIVLAEERQTLSQFRLLTLIEGGAPPLAELSARVVMKPPNVTKLIDNLVGRGWVTRTRRAADGRRKDLKLTPPGRKAVALARRACGDALRVLAGMGRHDPEHLVQSLDLWIEPLDVAAAELHRSLRGPRRGVSRRAPIGAVSRRQSPPPP